MGASLQHGNRTLTELLDGGKDRGHLFPMREKIERRSLAVQLSEQLEKEIRTGTWKGVLPGKRTLAERYGVNVKTCATAMDLLARRDVIGPAVVGRGRLILPNTGFRRIDQKRGEKRLLVLHQAGGAVNVADYHLLQSMSELWDRSCGRTAWATVDFPRCKSPGPRLDALVKRHSADALLLLTPGTGWHREAEGRLPSYLCGGPYEESLPISLSAYKIPVEVRKIVRHLRQRGHSRIIFPTEGLSGKSWRAIVDAMHEKNSAKPEVGTPEDYCPRFPTNVPEAWDSYWKTTLARLGPTAVIVQDDAHLLSLYGYCAVHGLQIPRDLSVISTNYEPRFEWLRPKPVMMRFPAKAALAHFQYWTDGGLRHTGTKFFTLEMVDGDSVSDIR